MPTTYFQNIADGIRTTAKGMSLTLRHLWAARHRRRAGDVRRGDFFDQNEGMVTVQYPLETIPIPDNGRYRLHNEMDDCIVCDKCAKICPVDCIEIEPIRATEEVGKASDGSPIRLYAAKFDIDMAKCCYCGLCTTVCPTECLTMTKTFDYSELDIRDMVYEFGNLTPAEAEEKKRLLEIFQAEKEALKTAAKSAPKVESGDKPAAPRPAFRPSPQMKPKTPTSAAAEPEVKKEEGNETEKPKAPFRPTKRPVIPNKTEKSASAATPIPETKQTETPKEKPIVPFRPQMKPPVSTSKADAKPEGTNEELPKQKPEVPFRPTMKPPKSTTSSDNAPVSSEPAPEKEKPKVPFRPTMKPPASTTKADAEAKTERANEELPKAKPKVPFRPTMKPPASATKADTEAKTEGVNEELPKAKPKVPFRPTMKPSKPKDE